MLDRLLGSGDTRHLVADLADVAETNVWSSGIRGGVVAFEHRICGVDGRESLGLPFVIDRGAFSRSTALMNGAACRRGRCG